MNSETFYRRKRWLRQWGWETETRTIRLHNARESPRHLAVKALLCLALQQRGRPWGTEVAVEDRGVVDVLDWGPPDGRAVAYEVEQRATPQHRREKVDRYAGGAVRDVLVVPVADAPAEIGALAGWVEQFVVG